MWKSPSSRQKQDPWTNLTQTHLNWPQRMITFRLCISPSRSNSKPKASSMYKHIMHISTWWNLMNVCLYVYFLSISPGILQAGISSMHGLNREKAETIERNPKFCKGFVPSQQTGGHKAQQSCKRHRLKHQHRRCFYDAGAQGGKGHNAKIHAQLFRDSA